MQIFSGSFFVKLKLLLVLLFVFECAAARGQEPSWQDFQKLLCKRIDSQEVQQFIKTNHLKQSQTSSVGTGVCENLTNVSFTLFYKSNIVQQVTIDIGYKDFASYKGKLEHGLRSGDTMEDVIKRLGKPSRQIALNKSTWLRYDDLLLGMNFDDKSHRLQDVTLYCK